jgi:hypothetical protein
MSIFSCSLCGYTSVHKHHIKNHIHKAVKCMDIDSEAEIIETRNTIECKYCDKTLSTYNGLRKHYQSEKCKINREKYEYKEQMVEYKEQMVELDKRVEKLEKYDKRNTNNITINNNVTIHLKAYNDPNLEGMEKYYQQAIKKAFLSVPYLIEKIHFNKEYPENQNIAIKNNRTKVAKVYNGQKWTMIDETFLIDQIINIYEQVLEDYVEENPCEMKHLERYREIKERDSEESVLKDLRDEVKKRIYENSGMIKIK